MFPRVCCTSLRLGVRSMATQQGMCLQLRQHGPPQDVLQLVKDDNDHSIKDDELLLDVLAVWDCLHLTVHFEKVREVHDVCHTKQAPINPSDMNMIEGKYPIKPSLPAVPGFECVARVRAVGSAVQHAYSSGDWVIPTAPGMGTWRQQGCFAASGWHKVANDIPIDAAATLFVNPPSALRMLEEFVQLQHGDVVVQNAANSAVGQFVVQMARNMGVHTVNVIRPRGNMQETVDMLRTLGADVVSTEDALKKDLEASGLPAPKLALNAVGGSSATALAKCLGHGGVLVTYGGMSLQPVSVPTSLLIFKDIQCRGFWLSNPAKGSDRLETIARIVRMYQEGKLTPCRTKHVTLDEYKQAMDAYYAGYAGAKLMFTPNPSLLA